MKTNHFNRYSYDDLLEKATSANADQLDVDTLGAWFAEYGASYWNGEYYDADGLRLVPVYEQDGDESIVIGYSFN